MKKFGLEEKYLNFVLSVLQENIPGGVFYIFGSRAKGNYKEYSDIDIAVKFGNEKVSPAIMSKIMLEFENSTLPYEVDVVDLNAIKAEFKSLIEASLLELKKE